MQTGDSEQDSGSAEQPSSLPLPVPGVPWWSGIGQQQPVSSAAVKAVYLDGISTPFRPTGFVYPHLMQPAPMQIVGQTPSDTQDPSVMTSTMQPVSQSGYEEANINDNQQQPVTSTVLPAPPGEYYLPQTQLELGHSMVRVPYPFADPYYGGVIAAYVAQGAVHPHMLGVQQARMPLPSEMLEEEPVYVNAKQYHGILRRRQSRAKAESENKLVKLRKPYLHESRHQHAMKRERGCGGRFLNTKSKEKSSTDNSNKSAGEQSSEESCAPDSCNANSKQTMTGPQNLGFQSVTRMPGEVTGGSEQSNANISGFTPSHSSHRPTMLSGAIQGSTYNHQNPLLHSSAFRPLAGRSDEDA